MPPKITITLTRYNEPNWLIWETLETLSRQKDIAAEVLFLDQQDDQASRDYTESLSSASLRFSYLPIPAKSLSFARNFAIEHASNDIVLFIDSDALAHESWASALASSFSQNDIGVVGGKIVAKWHRKPLIVTRSKVVEEQYSLYDRGSGEIDVTKVVGASFGLHRGRLGKEAYFDENLGRREGTLLGGEEVDLCARALSAGLRVRYNGAALVQHQILPERITYRWIIRRLYYAGISRATRGGVPEPSHGGLRLWDYVTLPFILPPYLLGYAAARLQKRRNV